MATLLTTLVILDRLTEGPQSVDDLTAATGESIRTVKRHLAEARSLGAEITSGREGGRYQYRLENLDAIERGPMRMWLEAERQREAGGQPLTADQMALKLE